METQTHQTLPTFFSMFVFVYLIGYFFIFRNLLSQHQKHIAEASSCLISLAHGTPVVFMAMHALITNRHVAVSPEALVSPNTTDQNSVLEYSVAYFALDLMHYVAFFPDDVLFILHHLATLYVLATCRYVIGRGAGAVLVFLVLAEASSACQNAWALAGIGWRARGWDWALRARRYLSPRFYALYSVFRVVLGPVFAMEIGFVFASGDVIPRWAWVSWMVVITTAILVSIVWVWIHWIEWFEEQRRVEALKKVV